MQVKPYVGITGFKTEKEVQEIGKIFENNGFTGQGVYLPMLGYLVSAKKLTKRLEEGQQSPAFNDLGKLVRAAPSDFLTMLHYHSENKDHLAAEVDQLFSLEGMYYHCKALQLNMPWPYLKQIEKIKETFSEMQIVLQIPKSASEESSLEELASRASEYDGLVSYALIDPSGGLGIPFEVTKSTELMFALRETMPNTMIGIAGGLSGENVEERVKTITQSYGQPFCIDAQGKLRTKIGENSILDLSKVKAYLEGAKKGLN